MKTVKLMIAALLFSLAAASAQANICATLYEHENYSGASLNVFTNQSVSNVGHWWNDRVTSVQVAPGCQITLYEHVDFKGLPYTLWESSYNVGELFNDQASSYSCSCDY